jgi:hypothetical protein
MMGWKQRGNHRYFYLSRWERGRAVSHYCGGHSGEAWASIVDGNRRMRALDRRALQESQAFGRELDGAIKPLLKVVREFVGLTMIQTGHHRHDRGPWRRKRVMGNKIACKVRAPEPGIETERTLEGAARGDPTCYDQAMALLESERGAILVGSLYNVRNLVKNALIAALAGKDYLAAEAMLEGLNVMAKKVAGPNPTAIEIILAETVAVNHFIMSRCELRVASIQGTMPQIEHEHRLLDRAHRRLMEAIETLATIRRLAVPVLLSQVNIARNQVVGNSPV